MAIFAKSANGDCGELSRVIIWPADSLGGIGVRNGFYSHVTFGISLYFSANGEEFRGGDLTRRFSRPVVLIHECNHQSREPVQTIPHQ